MIEAAYLFMVAGFIAATVITVAFTRGQTMAAIILLSLTVIAAAAVGVAALRTVAPLTSGVAGDTSPVIGGRTRAALEREKTLVLRSIKELEFDRAMGKLSEKDFAEMSTRLRARAARIIRQLDAGANYRGVIEQEISRRLAAGIAEPTPSAAPPPPSPPPPRVLLCPACQSSNDVDARFCKSCGARLEPESSREQGA